MAGKISCNKDCVKSISFTTYERKAPQRKIRELFYQILVKLYFKWQI